MTTLNYGYETVTEEFNYNRLTGDGTEKSHLSIDG